ncbi:MAG: Uma2 family endonuclease, partial [Waterburya sp.]
DLAIEVIFSSGNIDDLKKYHSLGVAEVWFWQNNKIIFYQLEKAGYIEIAKSVFLPNLAAKDLENFVNRGFNESPLTIEADFLNAIT